MFSQALVVIALFAYLYLKVNGNFQVDVYENGYPPRTKKA